jgi:hypothetical protein
MPALWPIQIGGAEIDFWYLANRLGRRFLKAAERDLQDFRLLGPGLWRGTVLSHPVYLVSTVDLPVDDESLPLHVLAAEPRARELEVGEYLTATAERLDTYGSVFAVFHQTVWREVETMARRSRRTFEIDLRPVINSIGFAEVIRQMGEAEVIRHIGPKKVVEQLDVQTLWDSLSQAKRRELKRLIAER